MHSLYSPSRPKPYGVTAALSLSPCIFASANHCNDRLPAVKVCVITIRSSVPMHLPSHNTTLSDVWCGSSKPTSVLAHEFGCITRVDGLPTPMPVPLVTMVTILCSRLVLLIFDHIFQSKVPLRKTHNP